MKHRICWSRFFLVASILTAVMIFAFSAQQGPHSQALSDGITLQVATLLRPEYETLPRQEQLSYLKQLDLVIRKNAHFLEYALLGFNLACWLRLRKRRTDPRSCGLLAWGIAALYAGTDELHQLFINGRKGALLDVGIDSAGSLLGVLLATLALYLLSRRTESH